MASLNGRVSSTSAGGVLLQHIKLGRAARVGSSRYLMIKPVKAGVYGV